MPTPSSSTPNLPAPVTPDRGVHARPANVLVRDVVRHARYQLSGIERMLRVPYDLLNPVGPVQLHDGLITYLQGGELRNGRVAEAELADARPGERVLLRLPPTQNEEEWWLCEVEEVDGVAAD